MLVTIKVYDKCKYDKDSTKVPNETTKRYQTNEWTIVHTSIHYF